jgi:outer membrane protein assembly factor BamD
MALAGGHALTGLMPLVSVRTMNRNSVRVVALMVGVLSLPWIVPAPLIYRPGEGWSYESVGGGKWQRGRAKDQLEVAQSAYDKGDYALAIKAARRTVARWPLSDYAPQAQYLLARSYEARGQDEKAFKAYQTLLTKYPKAADYQEILQRQLAIANRFLAGRWTKLWGYLPFPMGIDKLAGMYEKIVDNGPFSEVAPQAQLNIGAAREKQKEFGQAVKAYAKAADKYFDQEKVAADARFKQGMAYYKQAREAEYDQGAAGQAIDTFTAFIALFPNDPRVEEARQIIESLREEQARGSFAVARFYEKRHRWKAALVYFNDAVNKAPDSTYAEEAKQKIEQIKRRLEPTQVAQTP